MRVDDVQVIAPEFDALAAATPGAVFRKVDVDKVQDLAERCGISAMPTFQARARAPNQPQTSDSV